MSAKKIVFFLLIPFLTSLANTTAIFYNITTKFRALFLCHLCICTAYSVFLELKVTQYTDIFVIDRGP